MSRGGLCHLRNVISMDGINVYFTREEFMSFKKLFVIGIVVAVLVACGDDDSDFATRPSGDSSSACEDCDGSSSSKAKSSSSSSVTPQSSERETSVSSSSKKGDPGTSAGMTSSSSGRSSSGGTSSSSVKSSSSKDVELVETSSSSEKSSSSDGSSSSSAQSSSSSVASSAASSSSVLGTMTDERDGQTYKTVKIGTQTWMAENLNYAYTGVPYRYERDNEVYTSDSTSWCYDDDPANCAKYGRLYTWAAAMDSVGTWSANGKGCGYGSTCSPTGTVRGVCPEGWHLPTQTEWNTLFTAVGGQSTAGKMLKSTSGWNGSGNGTDAYSFSALPAGGRYDDGNFYGEGSSAYFWGSSEYDSDYAFRMYLYYGRGLADLDSRDKDYGFSVRCVKD